MSYFGDYPANATVYIPWSTTSAGTGSITRATDGTVVIYKNNSATQRTSAAGITDTEDFDSQTGSHMLTIDTSDDTDSGFYAAGNEYHVLIDGMVIGGQTFNVWIGSFSIERSGGILAYLKSNLGTAGAGATEAGGTGDHLTAVPWNSAWDAEVQSECTDALNAYDPPTNAEMEARTLAAASYATASALSTVDSNVDAILLDTAEIGTAGAGLTAVPWNSSWDAEVQSEVTDALNAYDPPTKSELDSGFAGLNDPTAAAIADAVLDEALSGHTTAGTLGKAVADIETDAAAILVDTAEIGTAGAGLTNINLPDQTMNITGDITGNLSGSVGSVTGNVGGSVASVTAGVTLANGAITNASLAGNMEIVFETDFATNYNTTRNAWATNVQDTVGSGNLPANTVQIEGGDATDALDAAVSGLSTHSAADVWAVGTRVLTANTNLEGLAVNATQIEGGDATDAINAACDASIETYHLDHLLAVTYDPASKPGAADALLNELVESDGGVSRFTENALEQAPTGGSAPTVEEIRAEIDSNSTQLAAIVADTNELQSDDVPGLIAGLNDPTAAAVADAVLDEALSGHTTAGTLGKAVADIETDVTAILADTNSLDGTKIPDTISLANINAECDTAISDASLATASAVSTVDSNVDAILTDTGTTIPAQITGLNNLSAAQVNTEVDTAISDAALATAAALATVDSNVDAIKAKTDSLTFTVAGVLDGNIQYVNDVEVTGVGTEGDPWGP